VVDDKNLDTPFNLVPLHFQSNSQPSLIQTNRDQSESPNSNPINKQHDPKDYLCGPLSSRVQTGSLPGHQVCR
jgi:hypothetical protein